MGDAVERLRDLVNLTIRVPSYVRHVDGKFIHVDAYTRKGKPAEKAPPKPKARVARTIPATLYAPQDLQTNENVKVAIDTIRQTLKTDLGNTLSSDTMENWLSAPETRDTLKSHAFLFDAVRKPTHKGQLTKAGKIMAGREWGRYDTLVRTSRLLARMKSGSISKPEAEKEFWDLMDNRLVPKVMGADYPISVNYIRAAMTQRAKSMLIGLKPHVPEKPTGEEPPEAVPPVAEVKTLPPGGITAGKTPEGEVLDIHGGDEVWIDMQSTSPADAWAIVVKHPDGTGHTVTGSPKVPAKVKETADITLKGLGIPGSGIKYKHYGTVVPEEPILGGKIDVLTIDVPQPSGEGTKKVVVGPGDEMWKGYGGAVGVHHLDDTWTVYDLGPDKHVTKDDPGWPAWDKVGKGENPNWEQIEPETVKASPPPKAEAPPAPEPKVPPKPKAKKKPKTVVPTAPLDGDDLDTLKNPTITYGSGDGVDQFMTKQRQRYLNALSKTQQEMGAGASAPDYWTTALGKQSTIDLLTEIVGKTETARTDPDIGLDPGQKAKLAKDRKRYEALLEAGLLARDLDTFPEDELDARMTSVGEKLSAGAGYYAAGPYKKMFTKGSKAWHVPNWPYNQKAIFPALQTRVEKRLFEVRKASLGFDPEKADDATLASFIADKGAGDIAPWLSAEEKRDWIRVWLRDPSILDKYTPDYNAADKYASVLEQLTKSATISMSVDKATKMANLDLHVHAVPEGPDIDQQKAIAEQLVSAQKRFELLKGLKRSYSRKNNANYLVMQSTDGNWYEMAEHKDPVVRSQDEVLDLLMTGEWDEDTTQKALTDYMIDQEDAKGLLGMPSGPATRKAQNTWIKDHGGTNIGKMTQEEREQWITAHLMQNNLMKYAIEDKAGKKAKTPVPHPGQGTHPGSPDSPLGKASWQMFSDQAAVSVWGEMYRSDAPVAAWTPAEVVTFATAMHLDYGFPSETGGIPETVARERVQDFLDILPGSLLPPVSPGLTTVVPGVPVKGPLTKPEGVSDDVFNLLEALKVVTPDQHAVALFSKQADKFTDEQVDATLKLNPIFGLANLSMAGIFSAPLPVKQAAVAATKGLSDEAPFPEGFIDHLKAQVQSGIFDPPKPEGYYGAVSNGDTVYYLQPGDKVMEAGQYTPVQAPVPGMPTSVTMVNGTKVDLQPGDIALQSSEFPGQAIAIRRADGTWQIGYEATTTIASPGTFMANAWESTYAAVLGGTGDYSVLATGPTTTSAPPKDSVYNNPLKPGDTVYIPPGYALGDTSVRVLHQDGSVDVVDPDGTHFLQTYTAQEWLADHNWNLIMTGPTAQPPIEPGSVHGHPLKPGDQVYTYQGVSIENNPVLVVHSEGDMDVFFQPGSESEDIHYLQGSIAAGKMKENIEGGKYKLVSTSPGAHTIGNGPVQITAADKVYQHGTKQAWVKHPDGSWALVQLVTTPSTPAGTVIEKHAPGSVAAEMLSNPANTIYSKPPLGSPAAIWKNVFTEVSSAAPPSLTKVHGFPVTPSDTVYTLHGFPLESGATAYIVHSTGDAHVVEGNGAIKHAMPSSLLQMKIDKQVGTGELKPVAGAALMKVPPKSVLWVQHGDGTGSWITANGVEPVTDEEVDGLFSASHPYLPLEPTSLPPKPIYSFEDAIELGLPPTVTSGLFDSARGLDDLPEDWNPPNLLATDEEIRDGLLTAKDVFGVEVSLAFIENAPPQVRRAIYDHIVSGAPTEVIVPLVSVVNWMAEKGHYGYKTHKPPFPPGKAYTPYILSGLTDLSAVSSWPYEALQQFQGDFKVNGAEAIAGKLDEVLNGKKPIVPTMSAANQPLKFSDDPTASKPGGSHSGNRIKKDQFGNQYLYKPYQNDPNPSMRVEQEVYASRISNLLGFHAPPVQDPSVVDGKYAYIQSFVPKKFDMQGVHPEDLDDNILTQVAEEHVLDWVISNADSYYSNVLVSGDGKHVVGIDKGQAFKFFPSDQLSPTYNPNPIQPYYNDLYAAVISKKITKERADAMVRHLLIRAKRVAHAHDPEYRELLEKAFEHRTDFKGMSKDEFIDALIERKHAVAESFEELWKGVYAKAGYTWDLPPLDELQFAKIETPRGSAWSGISPEYFEAVEETKVHGRAAMFAGTDLEDGHLLFFEEHDTEGNRVLLGEGKLREAADGRLTAWLQAQKVADSSGSVVTPQVYVLPKNDAWYQKIVAAAMTVNHHADDGEYNQAHLDALVLTKVEMEKAQQMVKQHLEQEPGTLFSGPITNTWDLHFSDLDEQDAFMDMIDTYLTVVGEIETAKANQTKTPNKKYTQYVYAPKPKAKVDEEWKSQGFILQKLETGEWHHIDESTGADEVIPEQQAADLITSGNYTQGSQGKAVTSLQVKVYKRKASRSEGKLDLDTGELKESGGQETTGSSGHEYDVEIGDRIVLEYRPWHGANQPIADQGFFRIRVKNWDGDEADLDLAFQQLAAMGVDLTPADEESLELLYWRLWEGVASTRVHPPAAVTTAVKNIKGWRTQNPNASAAEELEFLRKVWTPYLGEGRVANVDFMPKFDHTRIQNPDEETGRPYWTRPDAKLDDMLDPGGQWHFGSQNVFYGGTEADKVPIAKSGGLLSSDERLRHYGHWMNRGSSLGDKNHGSTGQVFTHPKLHTSDHIAFVPDVFLRMQTYAASGDKWGDVANKGNYAPFTVDGLKKSQVEMMVKNTVSVMDSIIIMRFNATDRAEIIKWYHDRGIFTIRGVPVEERFVVAGGLTQQAVAKAWEKELAWRAEQKQAEAALAA
jgi:hypothetical protein